MWCEWSIFILVCAIFYWLFNPNKADMHKFEDS